MESTLSSLPGFIPSHNKELSRLLLTKFQRSFSGKMICTYSSSMGRNNNNNISSGNRSSLVITSALGKKIKNEGVVPEPNYQISIVLLCFAGGLVYADNLLAAAPVGLLGLLLVQEHMERLFSWYTFRLGLIDIVTFSTALATVSRVYISWLSCCSLASKEVKMGEQLEESGENVFVGRKNSWKYSTFVNWELWWPNFPILVYFKETKTKPEG